MTGPKVTVDLSSESEFRATCATSFLGSAEFCKAKKNNVIIQDRARVLVVNQMQRASPECTACLEAQKNWMVIVHYGVCVCVGKRKGSIAIWMANGHTHTHTHTLDPGGYMQCGTEYGVHECEDGAQ